MNWAWGQGGEGNSRKIESLIRKRIDLRKKKITKEARKERSIGGVMWLKVRKRNVPMKQLVNSLECHTKETSQR